MQPLIQIFGDPRIMFWWATLLVSLFILGYEFWRKYSSRISRPEEWYGNVYTEGGTAEIDKVAMLLHGALRSPYKYEELKAGLADLFFSRLSGKKHLTEKTLQRLRADAEGLMEVTDDRFLVDFLTSRQPYPGLPPSPRRSAARHKDLDVKLAYFKDTVSRMRRWVQ